MLKYLPTTLCTCLLTLSTIAQTRYIDDVFTTLKVDSDIVYGSNKDYGSNFSNSVQLSLDFYQPLGDTASKRPLIILAHGGSFLNPALTGFAWANKKQNAIVELAKRYTKKGYVVASIGYRLGWAFTSADQETRAKTIINAVYTAAQDMKMAARFFRQDAATANVYKIDTSRIVLGGTNSGAYVALGCGYLNKVNKLNNFKLIDINNQPFIDQVKKKQF